MSNIDVNDEIAIEEIVAYLKMCSATGVSHDQMMQESLVYGIQILRDKSDIAAAMAGIEYSYNNHHSTEWIKIAAQWRLAACQLLEMTPEQINKKHLEHMNALFAKDLAEISKAVDKRFHEVFKEEKQS